jgi:hypothetical protein
MRTGGSRGLAVESSLVGLLAIELTFSRFWFRKSNKSTAARLFLPGGRLFDGGILLILGCLGLMADLGSDKKSCAVKSSEGSGELALILLRLCCGAKVGGCGDRISELPFCDPARRRSELPNSVALPDLGCFEPELGEDIEDITDNIDPLGNRSATSYSFITTVKFKFMIFLLASQSILDFRF